MYNGCFVGELRDIKLPFLGLRQIFLDGLQGRERLALEVVQRLYRDLVPARCDL